MGRSYLGRWPFPTRRVVPAAPPPAPSPPPEIPLAKPKMAALQHGTVSWRSDSGKQAILAQYDMLMMNMYTGLTGVPAGLDAIRAINPDIYITQYVQAWETRAKGIFSITKVSGTTYQVTLDGTAEGANSSMVNNNLANGVTMNIRQTGDFDGAFTVSGLTTTAEGRRAFNITASADTFANQSGTGSRGCCIENTDAMAARSLLAMDEDWMLRNTAGRIISSGVDAATRGVNLHNTVTPDSNGDYWPQVVADYNKPNVIDPFQPTTMSSVTGKGIDAVFIDNWNYRPRTSLGVWGTTPGGPVSGGAISQDDAALQTRARNANRLFVTAMRGLHSGLRMIGNADNDLDYPEWPAGTLDGVFIENVTESWMLDLTDKGATLMTRLRDQRAKLNFPGLQVIHGEGQGATVAIQQADYASFVLGLVISLMQGTSRENMAYYAFVPDLQHDVTESHVRHDEWDATLGEPIDDEQTGPRAATWVWVRFFEGGVALWNTDPSAAHSVDPTAVTGAPEGVQYKRIDGTTNPFNTGAAVTGTVSVPAKGGVILLVDEDAAPLNTKYVRAGATGTGSGDSWTDAYTALPATLTRGYTYFVADGTYAGYVFNDAPISTTLITVKKATIADHGTSVGWLNAYGDGQAVFGNLEFDTAYNKLDGVSGGNWATTGYGFKVAAPTGTPITFRGANCTVQFTEITGSSADTSPNNDSFGWHDSGGGDNALIRHCYAHDVARCHFFCNQSVSGVIVENSRFGVHGLVDPSVHSEIASIWGGATNWTFRYNLFTHTVSTGGLQFDGVDWFVYGNVFYRASDVTWAVGNGAIGSWTTPTEVLNNCKVFNNTFINVEGNGGGPLVGAGINIGAASGFAQGEGNEARNNIFMNGAVPDFTWFEHDHNHFVNAGGVQGEANGTSSSVDPFADYLGFNFHPTGPLTAGDSTLGSPYNLDPDGLTRGADGVWDRGAFEYESGAPSPPPPAPDTTPPTITSRTPAISATDVAIDVSPTVTFDEAMDAATITDTTFELRDAAVALVPASVSYDSGTKVATLNPTSNLANAAVYTAKVLGGSSGVKDVAGNALASDSGWSFTTVAAAPPPPPGGAPTFIQEAETAWSASPANLTTASFAVQVGDVLVAYAVSESQDTTFSTPTNSGTALTWTLAQTVHVSSNTEVSVWTATATAAESITVTVASDGPGFCGANVLTFRGSDGIGASAQATGSGIPTIDLTTTQDNSAIVVVVGDWNAVDGASRAWGSETEVTYFRDGTHYTVYAAYRADAGVAGLHTADMAAPSGQAYSIVAVEVKGS